MVQNTAVKTENRLFGIISYRIKCFPLNRKVDLNFSQLKYYSTGQQVIFGDFYYRQGIQL